MFWTGGHGCSLNMTFDMDTCMFLSVRLFQLFGYFQSDPEEQDVSVGEEVSVFMINARRRFGDAAGKNTMDIQIKYDTMFTLK